VLILWSHNMRQRVLSEPKGGYIGQEILTGLRNGTALFCCLDMQPSPDDICDTLEKQNQEFVADFRRVIRASHILPLGRPQLADGRERKQLEEDMRKLVLDLYYKIDLVRRGAPRAAGDDPRINNLLNLIDREHAVARIVDKGIVHVVSGRQAECRLNDLVQRLREIELPSIRRSGDVHWRVKIVRDGLDPNTAWVQRSIEWPVMAAQASGDEKFEPAVRAGLERVLDNLARRLELPRRDKTQDGFVKELREFLGNSADAFLIRADLEGGRDTSACDVKLICRLGEILAAVPHHKFKIMLAVMERERQRKMFAFFKRTLPPNPLIEMSIRLENVRRNRLVCERAVAS
jgi:hypothetical protein